MISDALGLAESPGKQSVVKLKLGASLSALVCRYSDVPAGATPLFADPAP
jgi:hypothetical protein